MTVISAMGTRAVQIEADLLGRYVDLEEHVDVAGRTRRQDLQRRVQTEPGEGPRAQRQHVGTHPEQSLGCAGLAQRPAEILTSEAAVHLAEQLSMSPAACRQVAPDRNFTRTGSTVAKVPRCVRNSGCARCHRHREHQIRLAGPLMQKTGERGEQQAGGPHPECVPARTAGRIRRR